MRLYLKLSLIVAVAALIHLLLPPAGRCTRDAQFAARCWLADQLQDDEMRAQLVDESYQRRMQEWHRGLAQEGEWQLVDALRCALDAEMAEATATEPESLGGLP